MYEYVFDTDSEYEIDTNGFCNDFSEIKQETLEFTPDVIHRRSTYPNGFILELIQHANKIVIKTNRELKNAGNGKFTVLEG